MPIARGLIQRSLWCVIVTVWTAGCSLPSPAAPTATPSVAPATATADPSPTATETPAPTATPLPTATATKASPFEAQLASDPELKAALCAPPPTYTLARKEVLAPILLYHHVGEADLQSGVESTSRYNVTAESFEAQLGLLRRLGYHTVGVSQIVAALVGKATLPDRAIAISFDDGWIDQYQSIFPLLEKYGFKGTFYIPSEYPGSDGTLTWDDLKEMVAAGMEVGSHSRTHGHLPDLSHTQVWGEIRLSKVDLEKTLGIPIETFAYPFGEFTPDLAELVSKAGYLGAVGLGPSPVQSQKNLYYLSRIEVRGNESLASFLQMLPWRGLGTSLCGSE